MASVAGFLVLILILLSIIVLANTVDQLIVTTKHGQLRGGVLTTYTGKTIYSFRGIRYAEAPSGPNRFKPPVPKGCWTGIRNATKDAPFCPQPYKQNQEEIDPEDCLALNVYTKWFRGKQPVMVFFHQGGFLTGSGNSYIAGPQYLLEKDIVFVTVNYRLGAFGFLSTGDDVIKGNNGLKDQVTALKWVKDNIAHFGGDPDRVTIFGCSAGATSVVYHMLSPMSSGSSLTRHPADLAKRLAGILGCENKTSADVYNCLKDLPPQVIANATIEIKDFDYPSYSIFSAVIEPDYGDGEERFLTADPLHLLETGQFKQVPFITGITADELAFRSLTILKDPKIAQKLDEHFEQYAPVEFMYVREGPTSVNISKAIRSFFFGKKAIDNSTQKELGQIYADTKVIFNTVQAAQLIAKKSSAPVYLYMFNYIGRYSHRYLPGTNTPMGVSHHDELIYLFYISRLFPEFNTTDPEAKIVQTMTSIWSKFAETGIPELPGTPLEWTPLSETHLQYLNITDGLAITPGVPYPERMEFWESQFPLTGPRPQQF